MFYHSNSNFLCNSLNSTSSIPFSKTFSFISNKDNWPVYFRTGIANISQSDWDWCKATAK